VRFIEPVSMCCKATCRFNSAFTDDESRIAGKIQFAQFDYNCISQFIRRSSSHDGLTRIPVDYLWDRCRRWPVPVPRCIAQVHAARPGRLLRRSVRPTRWAAAAAHSTASAARYLRRSVSTHPASAAYWCAVGFWRGSPRGRRLRSPGDATRPTPR
jgi:hypothetical protein